MSWKDEFATFLVSTLKNFLILELPEPSTDLKAWSFQLRKTYFCMLSFDRPIAHIKVRLSFFYTPCILIIHSGPVARTVPIENHGQDSSTSQLESTRFKYLRLKQHLKELRTCPECKNRYVKHTCIGPVTRCNFSCNFQRYFTLGRCKIGKYTFPSQFANIILNISNIRH